MTARKWIWLSLLGLVSATGTGLMARSAFFAQPACACANPGKSYAGTFARSQQAYFVEQGKFATAIKDLGTGIGPGAAEGAPTTTTAPSGIKKAVTDNAAVTNKYYANPADPSSFVSGVFVVPNDGSEASTTEVIICEAPTAETLPAPIDAQTCAPGTTQVE